MTNDDEDEMDDKVIMNNDDNDNEIEAEQPLVEELNVTIYEINRQIEVEVEPSATRRPKR